MTGGAIALAGPANAATTLTLTLSSSPDASATINSAGDLLLKVGSSSSTFAEGSVANVPTAAPSTAPAFVTDNYSSGSPRWVISLSGGDGLIGYPANAGLGFDNWQVTSPASGDCHVASGFVTYAAALAAIPNGCGGNVTAASIKADSGQASGTTDTITNISYAGMTLADVVTVTAPSDQTNTVGTAITTLTIKASSNTGSAITNFTATGLPDGLSIDATKGDITGTPTKAGVFSVKVTATDAATTQGSASFKWTINSSGPSAIYTGPVHLVRMGLCLDDRLNGSGNGSVVQVWRCNGQPTQVWQVENNGTIEHNGLCLDAKGFGTKSGTKVQLWACTGGANQKWDASKGFRIRYANPNAANEVLDDTAFGGSGTQQEIYTNNGGNNQIWATF
ncbi:MAG TPA: ricin-type beta-trefoil lectin domain protein [Streptosporangiaceae bacterium]|nr:ricin-type beta-trefoil lectin domain protein [Streptosporangiaceae bacterium]